MNAHGMCHSLGVAVHVSDFEKKEVDEQCAENFSAY